MFLILKVVSAIRIGEIIKDNQPDEYSKLKKHSYEKLTEKELKELMRHSSYKRCSGAIRQVR